MGRAIHLGSRCERIPQGGIGQAALKHIGRAMGGRSLVSQLFWRKLVRDAA